jgi:hypothetical protein
MKSKLVKLKDCPKGLFMHGNTLCTKTEYGVESYIIWSGEYYWGGAETKDEISDCLVLPISDKVVQRLERKYGRKYKRCEKWESK